MNNKITYDELAQRCQMIGRYIVESGDTVRGASKVFKISKSTVHKDLTCYLKNVNFSLYNEVNQVLQFNKAERHIRGGVATKKRYCDLKDSPHQNPE